MTKISKLFTIVFFFYLFLNVQNLRADEQKRIAVLPFENLMSEDKSINWLSSGISSEITTKLGAVPEITLIERMQLKKALEEQSFQLAGYVDPKTAVNIGKTLGAKVVVVGEYQKIGNQLKITARFVDVETAEVIKGKTAEATGNYNDIFKLENNISFQIVKALGGAKEVVQETKVKKEIEAKVTTTSISALEWIGKGNDAFVSEHYDKAIEYYTKAIEIDRKYADAYYFRGLMSFAPTGGTENTESFDKAIEDFTSVIELDPKNADAYYVRGLAYGTKRSIDEAIKDFTKVIELDPQNADAYDQRGVSYVGIDDEKAKEDLKKAADWGSDEARKNLKEFLNIDY